MPAPEAPLTRIPAIDCHGHLDPRLLARDASVLRALLARCRQQRVEAVVVSVDCSSGHPEHDLDALSAVFQQEGVGLVATLGFMPPTRFEDLPSAEERQRAATATMRRLADHPAVKAIGEVGLDYYWPVHALVERGQLAASPGGEPPPPEQVWALPGFQRFRQVQAEVLRGWLALAVELDLPVVIHERLAHPDTVALLQDTGFPGARTMFHCFGAGPEEAQAAAVRGSVVSLPSSIVIRERYRELAAATPLASIVTETDAPYHSPIVGLWKRARQAALAEVEPQQLPRKRRERAVNQARDRHFARALEAVLPGLRFSGERDGRSWEIPAAEHFRSGKARYRNECGFVRFAAPEIAALQARPVVEVESALLANARRFYGLEVP